MNYITLKCPSIDRFGVSGDRFGGVTDVGYRECTVKTISIHEDSWPGVAIAFPLVQVALHVFIITTVCLLIIINSRPIFR